MNNKTEVFERDGKGISEPTLLPYVRSSVQYRFWKGIFGMRYLTRNMVRVSGKRKIYLRDTVFDCGIRQNLGTGCGILLVKNVWECGIRIVPSRATFLDSRSWSYLSLSEWKVNPKAISSFRK